MTNVFRLSLVLLLIISLFSAQSIAKNPKSQGKGKGHSSISSKDANVPPGWSKGKKTGWHGSKYPPGWTKWDKSKQTAWTGERDSAAEAISDTASSLKIPEAKQNEMLGAFEEAIVGGVAINDAKNRLINAMKNDKERTNMMIDTSQTVLELLKK